MNRRPDLSRESGVSLIMVLVALTVFGLLVPVLGQFGSVNGVSGFIVKGQRFDRYAADNGVQSAIAYAQTRRTAGRAHVPCPDITSTMNGASTGFKRDVTVKCTGFDESGIPLGSDSVPKYAVLALAGSGTGIDILKSGRVKTKGPWWANSVGRSAIDYEATIDGSADLVGAVGGCKGSQGAQLFAAPNRCGKGDLAVDDPLYSRSSQIQAIGDVPVQNLNYDPVGGDPCDAVPTNHVLALAPGYYWDKAGLTKIGQGGCGPVVIWLQPGRFYFDFDFYNQGVRDSTWSIGHDSTNTKVVLVGGARTWDPSAGVDAIWGRVPTLNGAGTGGACDTTLPGVELVFGSAAHLEVQSPGRVELCPLIAGEGGGQQHLSIVGRTEGGTSPVVDAPVATPTSVVPGGASFTWPAALAPGSLDQPECTNNNNGNGCDPTKFMEGTLSGRRRDATLTMVIPNHIPAQARLDQLVITVVHREPNANNDGRDGDSVTAALASPMPGVDCTGDLRLDDRWHSDAITCDLDPNRTPMLALANFTLTLALHNGNGDGENNNQSMTFQADQVRVNGRSTAPSLRAESGCVLGGGCPLLFGDNSGGSHAAAVFVWGTVDAPLGAVQMDYSGSQAFKFARGVVVESFQLKNLPAASSTDFIPVSLPNGGIYSTRTVEFEAQVGTKTKLRARVEFADPVKSPDAAAKILSWDTHP
jgi:hypothetical protein